MRERFRTYEYFILGALGGLFGWFTSALLLRSAQSAPSLQHQLVYGVLLGALIGLCLAVREGLTSGSLRRLLRYGAISLFCGTMAGGVALPLAQKLYVTLLGNATVNTASAKSFLIGTGCWILLGSVIGFGETVNKGTQSWKGLLGGALGGLLGGAICESSRILSHGNTSTSGQMMLAVSLMFLGGTTGSAIALVTTALQRAWLEGVDGKFAGRSFDVTKFVSNGTGKTPVGMIGSDEWSSQIYLPANMKVCAQHTTISLVNGYPTLTACPEAQKQGVTMVNGENITTARLRDGDRITIGNVVLIYRQK